MSSKAKGLEPMSRRTNIIFIIIFAFLFVCKSYAGGIAITCYEKLIFKAGETKQSVNFQNPGTNSCFFRLTLMTEDGKELWHSDLFAPGEKLNTITLSEALEAGTYGAILKYECFALDDKSRLNGLNTELKLIVKENNKN